VETARKNNTTRIAVVGTAIVLIILVVGTILLGRSAKSDTEQAARTVSLLYLDELAGRREQVVENNLHNRIRDLEMAVSLMNETDLGDVTHLQAYQDRMRKLYNLEKFAFVDSSGLMYTSQGTQTNLDEYAFDFTDIQGPEISIFNLETPEKKVVIAIPVDLTFMQTRLKVCFMEIDMEEMLAGASITSGNEDATFCNIYTSDGVALSNTVLGGLAVEDNLLSAMAHAQYDPGYSYDALAQDFREGSRGVVSFTYNGIRETLSYAPVSGTNWLITYLIRENVISEKISPISRSIIQRGVVQSLLTLLALLIMFFFILSQNRKNANLRLESEKAETENRIKQEELQQRISLQERLLEEERRRTQKDSMITAMAADYRSVYHVDLDADEAVCYRSDPEDPERFREGEHFPYYDVFYRYAMDHVTETYRDGFLAFIDPQNIKERLNKEKLLVYRYLAQRSGKEYYEMIRAAGVRLAKERTDNQIHAIGVGFTVVDEEMRAAMAQQQALSDALAGAEEANRAKTAFLSSMSHEIRTPMNAIIGLDNIAMNDPDVTPKVRGYLEKIGSSAEHLLGLINDILDMSRIESGKMTLKNEEFSFRKLLEAINVMFAGQCEEKGLEYQCHVEGEIDDYYIGDNMKLRQVLINILGNAVKFTPEGGKVDLKVERTARFDGHTTLRFTIADTGIGMSPEFLPRIFDTFAQEDSSSTSRYGSSGLGMAITRNIVEMMNGDIQVESEKGKGSTFTVTVTLLACDNKSDGGDAGEIHPGQMSVLVVDDDPVACEHARLVLEKAGIASETADSGEQAIEMVSLRHARREPYDLILVDWQMPGMDGVETTRRIRSIIGDEAAIIILTAYRWDDVFEEAIKA